MLINRVKISFGLYALVCLWGFPLSAQMLPYPADLAAALDSAGANRPELEKVLAIYQTQNDSLKLQAADYLISNLHGHGYLTYDLRDSTGAQIPFHALDYPDFKTLEVAYDSLETRCGLLDFKKQNFVKDLNAVSAEFLIKQIDAAFRAWREKPWAQQLSFDQFCAYVLPYRGSEEPLENWRDTFLEKYQGLESRMQNPSDPLEAARLINDDLKSWFSFDPRYYYHPTDQGLSEMLRDKKGRCEDMTNLTIYAMRANGLAVTSDYTPYWANSGNNHAWNAIITPDGQVVPFMGAEANPGEYHLANKLAKVYRKTFALQKEVLAFQPRRQEKMPPYLSGKSYQDVTSAYTQVRDVNATLFAPVPDSVDIAYLCVFNSGEWKAIHWARIEQGAALFTNMGVAVAYLPALYVNEKIVPFGDPFISSIEGRQQTLPSTKRPTSTLRVISTTSRKQEVSTDGIARTFLTPGQEYELFYWDGGWQSLGKKVAGNKPLVFKRVPANTLYWLVATASDREERIFTLAEGRQVWW